MTDEIRAERAEERGQGICRTCLRPIWNEGGTIGHRRVAEGWSDRIERGGDSVVCFKARDYRHVPLGGREACIYDMAVEAARAVPEEQTAPSATDREVLESAGAAAFQEWWDADDTRGVGEVIADAIIAAGFRRWRKNA